MLVMNCIVLKKKRHLSPIKKAGRNRWEEKKTGKTKWERMHNVKSIDNDNNNKINVITWYDKNNNKNVKMKYQRN